MSRQDDERGRRWLALMCVSRCLKDAGLATGDNYGALEHEQERKKMLQARAKWLAVFWDEQGGLPSHGALCEKVFLHVKAVESENPAEGGQATVVVQAEALAGAQAEARVEDLKAMIPETPLSSWAVVRKSKSLTLYEPFTGDKPILVERKKGWTTFDLSLGMENETGRICQGDVIGRVERKVEHGVVVCVGQEHGSGGGALSIFVVDLAVPKSGVVNMQCKSNIIRHDLFVNKKIPIRCTVAELGTVKDALATMLETHEKRVAALANTPNMKKDESELPMNPMATYEYEAGWKTMNHCQSAVATALQEQIVLLEQQNLELKEQLASARGMARGTGMAEGKMKGKSKKGAKVEADPAVAAAVAPVLNKLQELKDQIDTSEAGSEGADVQGLEDKIVVLNGKVSQMEKQLSVLIRRFDDVGNGGGVANAKVPQAPQRRKAASSKGGASKKKKAEEVEGEGEEDGDDLTPFRQGHSGAPQPTAMYVMPQAPLPFNMAPPPPSYVPAQFFPQGPVGHQLQAPPSPFGQFVGAESVPKRQHRDSSLEYQQWLASQGNMVQHVLGCVCAQCRRHSQ